MTFQANDANTRRIDFPANKYGGRYGYRHIQHTDYFKGAGKAQITYSLFVPKDFIPVKGGKLPGVALHNGACLRLMWLRTHGNKIGLRWYLLNSAKQPSGYNNHHTIRHGHGRTSDHLFAYHQHLERDKWNSITWTLDYDNKTLSIKVNNVTCSIPYNFGAEIRAIHQHFFYGGSNRSWAPPSDQYLIYSGPVMRRSGHSSINAFGLDDDDDSTSSEFD